LTITTGKVDSVSHTMPHDHDHTEPPSAIELRVKALESLLVEKRLVDVDGMDELLATVEQRIGPRNGASVVARAWVDEDYRRRALADGSAAAAELGFAGVGAEHLFIVANTPEVHNLIVCTLCSCYPWAVLGLPPTWYKDSAYRARSVIDPRGVLQEFGLQIPGHKEVRVWDSNAEIRYMVLPERPADTAGWSEERLRTLVTRNAMIGVGLALSP
jgi:nitrile hydratase